MTYAGAACMHAAAMSSMGFGSVGDTFRASCTAGTHAHAGFSVGIDLWNAPPPTLSTPPRAPAFSLALSLFFARTHSAHVYACTREHYGTLLPSPSSVYGCVRACVTFVSLFLLVADAVRRPLPLSPPSSGCIPSAIRGVTASFGWVRAKETDENRAGICETRSKGGGEGKRKKGEGSLSNLYRGLCTL